MNRQALKAQAKLMVNSNFKFYFLLFLPFFILQFIQMLTNKDEVNFNTNNLETNSGLFTGWGMVGTLASIVASLLLVGIMFIIIDLWRDKETFDNGLYKSTNIFSSSAYFISSVVISLLQLIWIVLWTLLLIIPGIIKAISYSQAVFIYRDALDAGETIRYRDAVTASRRLMDGHKWEYVVLKLSFIGWFLLMIATLGLAAFWVLPYYYQTMAGYYVTLKESASAIVVENCFN